MISTLPVEASAPLIDPSTFPHLRVVSVKLYPLEGDPVDLPIQAPNNLVSFKAGASVSFDIQVENADGEVLPFDGDFTLPLAGQMGTPPRIIDITFKDGLASVLLSGWTSGRWRVTEAEVNIDQADDEPHFLFNGLTIKVRE